ncbi:DNA/RNA polymerase [Abortiporus biennis]|nr:DNA/RNA polymerase [Abortiporus biennis]
MIPLARRTAGRVSYSRQSLPRPARLYSSPSKRVNAEAALATETPLHSAELYPPYPTTHSQGKQTEDGLPIVYEDMETFLRKRVPYTMLPTPLPADRTSTLNDFYFMDSPTQDQVSIIDACLHNLYDVNRAKEVFGQLRKSNKGENVLNARLYNTLLEAYVETATSKDTDKKKYWIEEACTLYEIMERGSDGIHPTATTYATMLRAWIRFNPESDTPVPSTVGLCTPKELLQSLTDRQIPVALVLSDRSMVDSEETSKIIQLLSLAAVDMNMTKVINELGLTESLGSTMPNPLENIPEVKPVLKLKKRPEVVVSRAEDGSVTDIDCEPDVNGETEEYEVPFNLDNLRRHLADVILAKRVLSDDAAARQKLLESSVYDVAQARLKHQSDLFNELRLSTSRGLTDVDLRKWMWEWHQKLQVRLKAEIQNVIEEEARLDRGGRNAVRLSPFLSLLKPEKLSMITILEIMHLNGTGGVNDGMKTARAVLSVGKAVELEYKAEMCRKNNISFPSNTARSDYGYFSGLGYRDLHQRRVAARKYMEDSEEWTTEWSQLVRVRVGSFLVDALMDVALVTRVGFDKKTKQSVSEQQPAFFHSYEYQRGQKLGVIKLNAAIADRMSKDNVSDTLHPRHLPMLVKPKPWLSHDQGGYLYNKTSVMRYKDSQEQSSYLRQAAEQGSVELIFAGLDVLGTTPWKINKDVFDVVLEVWNSGEGLAKVPPAVFDSPEPPRPANADSDPAAKANYQRQMAEWVHAKANLHSDRCSINYKIEIARTFLGDTIYMPHNVDFRGRAYPIPPHLNHIGNDLSRGLLKFGESKPLGERGLRWLKIHLANLYGFDKADFEERVTFVHDHLDDIYDSATNPLKGRKWWATADDPWQCLACCMELHNALESPDPLAFESSLPVHQDGTCNGLQHYAALGGDDQGAKQVNLDVTDRPSDVYTYVANMVEGLIKEDAANGNRIAQLLQGKIARKVVKQTVMTTVYGVTFVGAREQIEKQLKARGDIPLEDCWDASAYIAKHVLKCIENLFGGAKEIMDWLTVAARLISKSIPPERVQESMQTDDKKKKVKTNRLAKEQMTSVIWTTPLGLPIVQPYRQLKRKQIITALQSIYIADPTIPAAVNPTKQASAFPPNFIHSLDATHMLLTALDCRSRDITFASVHDSYWTHACTVDAMSAIIRDTFIALHSSEVLKNLHDEFKDRYAGFKVPLASLQGGFLKKILSYKQEASEDDQSITVINGTDKENNEQTDIRSLLKQYTTSRSRSRLKAVINEEGEEADESELAVPANGPMSNKFIELTELFPPLPKKGGFDVSTIKKSLYFFS